MVILIIYYRYCDFNVAFESNFNSSFLVCIQKLSLVLFILLYLTSILFCTNISSVLCAKRISNQMNHYQLHSLSSVIVRFAQQV